MEKKHLIKKNVPENLRLDPQARLCSRFDDETIAKFPIAQPGEMGMRVLDNFTEEHIM